MFLTRMSCHIEDKNAIQKLPYKQIILFACECARSVLYVWNENDDRPLKAIQAAELFVDDDAVSSITDAISAAYAAANTFNAAHLFPGPRPFGINPAYVAWAAANAASTAVPAYAAAAAAAAASYAASAISFVYDGDDIAVTASVTKWKWIHKLYLFAYRDGKVFPEQWKTPITFSIAKDIVKSRNFSIIPAFKK
jgi:hypothetical protein